MILPAFALGLTFLWFTPGTSEKQLTGVSKTSAATVAQHKIQVAILLDVSNSMDGLIEQAKAQLWNMVSVMGKATCDNIAPTIEISLYEYGRPTNNSREGYVKQLSKFTTDLDNLSKTLFSLKTNGGDEYCGHVMWSSLKELNWDTSSTNYKVIFIAGNEEFLQGDITYTKACAEATRKGVIVNTIYCGDKMQGIREHWNLAGECGKGSFTNIDPDAAIDNIATPYDSILFSLNDQLNNTYISYGAAGGSSMELQASVDKMNYTMNKSVAAARVAVKGKKQLYQNTGWDLVDAQEADSMFVTKVDLKTLPVNLQKKNRTEIKHIIKEKSIQRENIQKSIGELSTKREKFIAIEKTKTSGLNKNATLENEVEKIIRSQAKRFRMIIP